MLFYVLCLNHVTGNALGNVKEIVNSGWYSKRTWQEVHALRIINIDISLIILSKHVLKTRDENAQNELL
jgi:hypothetical protein